jgi:hypothetical protein
MNPLSVLLLVHAAATMAMCGLVWFVQIVHYPLFGRVGVSCFPEYEARHTRLTSFVVVPFMLVEVSSAVGLLILLPNRTLSWVGMAFLLLVWASTFLLQVPQHRRLARGYDEAAQRRLVRTNWIRTFGWSVRGAIALTMLAIAG